MRRAGRIESLCEGLSNMSGYQNSKRNDQGFLAALAGVSLASTSVALFGSIDTFSSCTTSLYLCLGEAASVGLKDFLGVFVITGAITAIACDYMSNKQLR